MKSENELEVTQLKQKKSRTTFLKACQLPKIVSLNAAGGSDTLFKHLTGVFKTSKTVYGWFSAPQKPVVTYGTEKIVCVKANRSSDLKKLHSVVALYKVEIFSQKLTKLQKFYVSQWKMLIFSP